MDFYTREEVAATFRVHVRTVDRWMKKKRLSGYKFGRGKTATVRIDKKEVERFLKKHLT